MGWATGSPSQTHLLSRAVESVRFGLTGASGEAVSAIGVAAVPEEWTIVAVEHNAEHRRAVEEIQRFLEQPAWRFMRRHDQKQAVDPPGDQRPIGDVPERWSVDDDVVVLVARLLDECF